MGSMNSYFNTLTGLLTKIEKKKPVKRLEEARAMRRIGHVASCVVLILCTWRLVRSSCCSCVCVSHRKWCECLWQGMGRAGEVGGGGLQTALHCHLSQHASFLGRKPRGA